MISQKFPLYDFPASPSRGKIVRSETMARLLQEALHQQVLMNIIPKGVACGLHQQTLAGINIF